MEEDEIEFNEALAKTIEFETDLKAVFLKHKVELKEESEPFHGGCDDVIHVMVDGRRWYNWNFNEVLTRIKVIK